MDRATQHDPAAISWPLDTSAPVAHALLIQKGNCPATRVSIGRFPFVVGRARPASLVLNDRALSRTHCRLDRDGDLVILRDLGSSTGTFLNGTRLSGSVSLADGHLIRAGNHTLRYLSRGRTEEEEAAALLRERQEASAYVAAILPPRLRNGPVLTDYMFRPSKELSGDAFGYQWLDDRCFTIFMLDVAGHGTAAALHAVSAANAIRQRMLPGVNFRDPSSVLGGLNRVFPMERHDERFFTIWYAAYDRETRVLRFASGGHHPGYLVHAAPDDYGGGRPDDYGGGRPDDRGRAGQTALPADAATDAAIVTEYRQVQRVTTPLATRNPAIGITLDRRFESQSVTVPEGGALHLFSDGAFEHRSHSMDLQDLVALLPQACGADGPQHLYNAVLARTGQPEDDFSALLVRFA